MKEKDLNLKFLKFYFILALLSLSSISIKCSITDFTLFPEDAETAGTESIFKDMASDQNILSAVQYSTSTGQSNAQDNRGNLRYNKVNNCIIPKYLDAGDGSAKTLSGADYVLANVDKSAADYNKKTSNTYMLKSMLSVTLNNGLDAKYTGFICNFDVSEAVLNGDNVLNVYLYTSQVGTDTSLHFCKVPNPGNNATTCEFWESYGTEKVSDFKTTDKGFDLNILSIRRNSGNNAKIDLKVGSKGTWQTAKETSGGKVYLRFSKASAGEILIGPSLNTVTRTVGNAAVNMIQPGTCANNNLRCIQGYYCKSSGDTCTGVCHNSCLECTGTASTNCSQCSPMSDRGSLGPSGGSCGNVASGFPLHKMQSTTTVTLSTDNLYSHAATLSFWAFVEDNTAFGDNTFSVDYENRVKIWVGTKGGNKMGAWCIPRPNFYQNIANLTGKNLQGATTKSQLETQKADTEKNVLFQELGANKDSLWFNVKCAYTIIDKKQYLTMHQKDLSDVKKDGPKAMKLHNYVKTEEIDFPFRDFTSNNKITFRTGVTSKAIYLKGVTAFIDYIPNEGFYEYFQLQRSSSSLLSSLIFYSEMSSLALSSTTLSLTYIQCNPNLTSCTSNTTKSVTLSVSTLLPPTGFYKLNLLPKNKYFNAQRIFSDTIATITCTSNALCFKNNKHYACAGTNVYLKAADQSCVDKCTSPAAPHRLPNLNSSYSSYCGSKCGTAVKCITTKATDPLNDTSNHKCETNYSPSYLFCTKNADDNKGAMHYGSMFSPPNVTIPVSPSMDKYHLEIWYFPEPRYRAASSATDWTFFETNNWKCKKNSADLSVSNDYACYNGANKIGSDVTMKFMNWQRLAFTVTGSGTNFNFYFHFNKYNAGTANQTVNASLSLTQIKFCTVGCSNQKWAAGFYKWLKIYDAQFLPLDAFKAKDVVFTYSDIYKVPVFNPVKLFYPMTLKYLAGKVKEYNQVAKDITVSTGNTGDSFRAINYSASFFTETDNKYSNAFTVDANEGNLTFTKATCSDANCKSCSDVECYTCKNTHYLIDGVCKDTTGMADYFLSPGYNTGTTTPSDITLANFAVTTNFTISFFMKYFARVDSAANSVDVLRIGTNLKLRMVYNTGDSTAKLQLYSDVSSSDCTIADYGDYLGRFGKWTHISMAFYYDAAKLSYYPANLNFQVNFTPVKTSYSCYNKVLGITPNVAIVFPKEVIALYGRISLWDKYFTGEWGYESFKTNSIAAKKEFLTSCPSQAGKDVNCYKDYTKLTVKNDYCATDPAMFNGTSCLAKQAKCPYGYFVDNATTDYCSCENKEKKTWIINKDDTRHYCTLLDYNDILKHLPVSVSSLKSGTTEYTFEFWMYMDTYVPANFHGILIEWNKHLKFEIGYTGGSYFSKCYPRFIEGDNTAENSNNNQININPTQTNWAYIRCSVDMTNKLYFHHDEILIVSEQILLGTHANITGDSTLKIKGKTDNDIAANSGVMFIRQMRTWKCYLCQDMDTFKFDMTIASGKLYTNLLSIYESPYNDTPKISNVLVNPATDTNLTANSNWLGYNALNASTYKKLDKTTNNNGNGWLCDQWRDVCTGLVKLNQIENITWTNIDPPMYDRFAIDLWFMTTSTTNLSNGIHFIWRNIGSISFTRDETTKTTLNSYCWPQDHRLDLQNTSGSANINGLKDTTAVVNYDRTQKTSADKQWVHVRCSVNWTNRFFYMSSNNQKTLVAETVYGSVKNDAPFKYMWQNNQKSNFYVWNGKNNASTDSYTRSINLYTEYIPPNFDVKNADISRVNKSMMPHLAANFSFGLYFKNLNKLLHYIGDTWGYTNFTKATGVNTLTYDLYSVLATATQCNVARGTTGMKYNAGQTECAEITSCDKNTLKVRYCKDEAKGIVCADNYHWDALNSATNGNCQDTCSSTNTIFYVRAPGSSTVTSLCNITCDPNFQKCQNLGSSEVISLFTNYTCKADYDRVAYNCILRTTTTKSYIYLNGCLNYPNFTLTFPTGLGSILGRGYTVGFWMKIDRKNEFCTVTSPNRKYYFIGDPHIIYYEADSTTTTATDNANLTYSLYYELVTWTVPGAKVKLTGISQFNWNHISIHADLLNRKLDIAINYNTFNPAVKFRNIPNGVDLSFRKIMFCSNNCTPSNSIIKNINWGAAWYKSIRVADGINFNPWGALDYSSGIYTAALNTQHFDYPFTVNQSLYNSIANLRGLKQPFDFYAVYNSGSLYNAEKTYNFNYGSTFDYAATNPGEYIATQSMTSTSFTTGGCRSYCSRCASNEINSCTECVSTAKLFGGNCYKKNGKFLKMPLLNYTNKFLSLNVEDQVKNYYFDKEQEYTITIWIKYEGQLLTNTDKCVTIFRFMKDGTKYICYDKELLKLFFYDNGRVMYEDTGFTYSIGQWSLISLASFMNNISTIKNLKNYFPYRYNFFVNNVQLVQKPEVVVPPPGWKFDTIQIGYGFSAIITDVRIYKNFITNPWGYVTGPKNGISIEFRIPINGRSNNKCLTDNEIDLKEYNDILVDKQEVKDTLGVQCVDDFSPYATGGTCSTGKYFDTTAFSGDNLTPCTNCENTCNYNCANADANGLGCTCDWNSADSALRIDPTTKKTKCELLPYTEFSKLEEFSASGLGVGKDGEYSIELWYYMYTYTNTTSPFENEEIIWDNHLKLNLFAKNDIMNIGCTPVYRDSDPSKYTFTQNEALATGLFRWTYITCSVSTNKGEFYGTRGNIWDIETPKYLFPNLKTLASSSLIFRPGKTTPANYGMLFIKDIKLWSIYNIKRFETKCYRPTGVAYHEQLLHYFRNDEYTNSIKDEITPKTAGGTKRPDFFGYNVLNLKTRQEMIQAPFGICSVINVYPITGVINVTKFTVQSKENEQLQDNRYRFYYYIKNVSTSPISIANQLGNPDVNVIFEYPEMPEDQEFVKIELYVEVTPQLQKSYTLFKQLTLYRESNEASQLNYDYILQTLTINSDMNDDMILDAQKSINRLETDLPKGLTSTFNKPKPIRGKNTLNLAKANCQDSTLCNDRGTCYNVEVMSYCSCNSGYTGRYCQLLTQNAETLKKKQKELNSIMRYNLFNNTNYANDNAVSSKELEALSLGFKTDVQNFDGISDMNSAIDTMDLLIKNSDQGNLQKVLTQNRDSVIDIPSQMLGYLQDSVYKTKYDNLKQQIISSGNYIDPDGKYTVRYLNNNNGGSQISNVPVNSNTANSINIKTNVKTNSTIITNSTNSNNSTKTNSTRRRKLTRKDFKRNLQQTSTPISDFVININDPTILSLTPEQNAQYKQSYQKVYDQFDALTKTFINGSLGNPIKMNKANTMYNYTLDHFYFADFQKVNFSNYFADRILNGETYFNPKKCIMDNLNYLKAEGYDYFYIAFYFDETPFFNFSKDLLDRSISLNSFFTLFDAKANEVKIKCLLNPIEHYIGIYPQNKNFTDLLTLYPEKYRSTDPIYQSREYMPYFIFPNGTIDHTNPINVQRNMYYRQYLINITDYKDPDPKDIKNFKYMIDYKYLVAEVTDTGNLAAFAYFQNQTGMMSNTYYFKYNQIFQCTQNFTENACFILLICFLSFNLPILGFIMCCWDCCRNFKNVNEHCKREEEIMEKDSAIFGYNRYSFWGNTGVASDIPLNSSKVFNNNMVMDSQKNVESEAKKNEGEENENDENKFVMKENKNDEDNDNKMQKVDISNSHARQNSEDLKGKDFSQNHKGICYSMFYFIIFRNIYSSFLILTSPFNPKWKTYSKFMFLIWSEMLFTSLLFVLGDFDLFNKLSSQLNQGQMFSYIFSSVLISNIFFVLFSILSKPSNKVITNLKSGNFNKDDMKKIRRTNILKTFLWNLLDISVWGAAFYVSFGFCSVWKQHARLVLVLWILTFIFDFIFMEICLEFMIALLFICRKFRVFRFLMKFLVAIKSLRNYH